MRLHLREALAATLAERYTVVRYDRRGRGDSGESRERGSESVQREVEDLDAVAAAAGGAPFAYGHSSGGALVLEAAARGVELKRIAVYEPPYTDHAPDPTFAQEIDDLVREGRRSEAAERFLALTGAPPAVTEGIKSSPGWPWMEALAHTLPRDLALGGNGGLPAMIDRIAVPLLALAGGASAAWARSAARAIADAVPAGETTVLEGQHHDVADEALLPILHEFLA